MRLLLSKIDVSRIGLLMWHLYTKHNFDKVINIEEEWSMHSVLVMNKNMITDNFCTKLVTIRKSNTSILFVQERAEYEEITKVVITSLGLTLKELSDDVSDIGSESQAHNASKPLKQ